MSLWQIAARNVWQSRGRYIAYLASSAFSVMIYFLYSALIYHPRLSGGYRGAAYVAQGTKGALVVIAIFTFFFLLYSNSAFVRSRMKEFGLLTLLGTSRRQLVGLIVTESLIVGAVAIAFGTGLGLLFLKLFFMAISALLHLPEQIPFYAAPRVWKETLSVFGALFLAVSLASLKSVVRRNIIELVRAGRQPKGAPTFSRWKAVSGVLLVLVGYLWASVPNPTAVVIGVLPVTVMVTVGTYFLMREGAIAFLSWLHRRERYFYRPGAFLSVSQLIYKIQDNNQVLSNVASLVAVILTAVGTALALYVLVTGETVTTHPHAIQVITQAGPSHAALVDQVDAVLKKHGVTGLKAHELITRKAVLGQIEAGITLLPYSFYTSVARTQGVTFPLSGPDEAIVVSPLFVATINRDWMENPREMPLLLDGQSMVLQVKTDHSGRVTNAAGEAEPILVVSDATFGQLTAQIPAPQQLQYTFWDSPDWRSRPMLAAATELRTLTDDIHVLSTTAEVYHEAISSVGLVLFIGFFISLVFFAACFSLLYFRLFTEIDEDRKYFRRLQQVGATAREMKRLALSQAALIFFVPFAVGLLHSTFAMRALGTLMSRTVLQYGWGMAMAYLVLYILCFMGTYRAYWRSVQAGLVGQAS